MQPAREQILIINDEPLVLEMFECFFRRENFEVYVTCSACRAVDLVKICSFSYIICDVDIGGENGIDLLEKIQKLGQSPQLFALSESPSMFEMLRAKKLQITYLSKPVSLEHLSQSIQDRQRENFHYNENNNTIAEN